MSAVLPVAITIALVAWVLWPVLWRPVPARTPEGTPRCPNCGPRPEGDAKYCSNCGASTAR